MMSRLDLPEGFFLVKTVLRVTLKESTGINHDISVLLLKALKYNRHDQLGNQGYLLTLVAMFCLTNRGHQNSLNLGHKVEFDTSKTSRKVDKCDESK